MKNILKVLLFCFCTLIMASCNTDFLNQSPADEYSEVEVFKDPTLIEVYVNGIYSSIHNPVRGADGVLKAEFVDEAHDMWYSFNEFNNSVITPDFFNWWFETWGGLYTGIRKCNMFFKNVGTGQFDNTKTDGKTLKERLTGEVYFIRALFYHQLVSLYGGVPLVTTPYNLADDYNVPRSSYADCIKYIVQQCDSAASLLPEVESGANAGRATKGAALALKSQVLLYAASDLHNNNAKFSGFSKPELLGYTSGSSHDRWLAAKNAAKQVMNLGLYSLYKPNPSLGEDIAQNYSDIFIAKSTSEDIWVKYYNTKYGGEAATQTNCNDLMLVAGPNGYWLWGQDTPVGNLVDDYEMSDGSSFSWRNPTQAAQPYKNRDPRFYGTVLYEGAKWITRTSDGIASDPIGQIQVGTWEKWNNTTNQKYEVYGLDTRNGPFYPFNGGYTGYYLRKFIDPVEQANARYQGADTPWRYFRYTEILLNYAEACIELGEEGEALTYINMIRTRAGMPSISETGSALRDRYRHERRIELAYEDKRFYDVRRWLIGETGYQDATGVTVTYELNSDHSTAAIPTIVPIVVQQRTWLDKAYFLPFYRSELNKNTSLIQNPGYN